MSDGNGNGHGSAPFAEESIEHSVNEYLRVLDAVKRLNTITIGQSKRLSEIVAVQNVAAQDIAQLRADLTRCLNATTTNGLTLDRIEGKFDQLLVELKRVAEPKAVTSV